MVADRSSANHERDVPPEGREGECGEDHSRRNWTHPPIPRGVHPYLHLLAGCTILALHSFSVQVVRRGLLQGSVLSPRLARAIIARTVNAALPDPEISRYSYSDDLAIGASTKQKNMAAKQAVTKQFSSLLAGPIELHGTSTINANWRRLNVLRYRLEPRNGYKTSVHVKPWSKRTKRFKNKLAIKLEKAEPGTALFAIAEGYRVNWFNSHRPGLRCPKLATVSLPA